MGESQSKPRHWQQDSESLNCHHCMSKFSVTNRRHHCRYCGHIFCNMCSCHKGSIPSQGIHTPVRLCSDCHGSLHGKTTKPEGASSSGIKADTPHSTRIKRGSNDAAAKLTLEEIKEDKPLAAGKRPLVPLTNIYTNIKDTANRHYIDVRESTITPVNGFSDPSTLPFEFDTGDASNLPLPQPNCGENIAVLLEMLLSDTINRSTGPDAHEVEEALNLFVYPVLPQLVFV
eukprot:Tbor_TRINITY_DN6057_c2_g1::TRINITY_DN6057_c2_g1_i1::g.10813::m.10813